MSEWRLFTGVTGLLGQYLLCDALRRREPTAVLVRDRRGVSASDRVNRLLSVWENRLSLILPRPVILEGDLRTEGLSLTKQSKGWFQRNVRSVVHSAASVRFEESPHGEPMNSNFAGTQRLLELCRDARVEDFHYVSTAYVCGQTARSACVREELHSRNGPFRNVYEQSKCLAEHSVMAAEGTFTRTIYRPSIIVGEWDSGYSPSFNAIYTPLQLVWTMFHELKSELPTAQDLLTQLGMDGTESRNVVTVDWVTQAIGSILREPSKHGAIYHLTNSTPTKGSELLAAISEAIRLQIQNGHETGNIKPQKMDRVGFGHHMAVYRSYFSSDPIFDSSRLQSVEEACPPCPPVGRESLRRAFDYAIRANFKDVESEWAPLPTNFPGSALNELAARCDSSTLLPGRLINETGGDPDSLSSGRMSDSDPSKDQTDVDARCQIQLSLSGPGGGCWRISGDSTGIRCGRPETNRSEKIPRVYGTAAAYRAFLEGEFSFEDALRAGALIVTGESVESVDVLQILKSLNAIIRTSNRIGISDSGPVSPTGAREVLAVGNDER